MSTSQVRAVRSTDIRVDTDETGRAPALAAGVVERGRLLAYAGLQVGEKNRVVIALHDDLVFEPDAGHERGAGRVVLHGRLVGVQVPDAVPGLDFVDRAGAVLELAWRLRTDAIEVFRRVAGRCVVNLHFKARDHRFPRGIPRIEAASSPARLLSSSVANSSVGLGKRMNTPLLWALTSTMRNCRRSVKLLNFSTA